MPQELQLSQLCNYYHEVLKLATRTSGLINIESPKRATLYPAIPREPLLFKSTLTHTFIPPSTTATKNKNQKPVSEETQEQRFYSQLRSVYNKYLEDQAIWDILYGLVILSGTSRRHEKHIEGPLLLINCNLEYDTASGGIIVKVSDEKLRLNTSLLFELLDDDTANIAQRSLVENLPELPLSIESLNAFLTKLPPLIQNLHFHPLESDKFQERTVNKLGTLVIFDALLFIARKGNYFVIQDLETIAQKENNMDSSVLEQLIRGPKSSDKDLDGDEFSGIDQLEHFFPKPWNKAQQLVAKHISDGRLLVVTGPPGTGKTHAITNLICHLIAKQKTVLVSSEKNQALVVLSKEHLGRLKLKYAYKTLLKHDAQSKRQLIREIENSITYKQNLNYKRIKNDSDHLREEIKKTKLEIDQAKGDFNRLTKLEQEYGELFKKFQTVKEEYDKIPDETSLQDPYSFTRAVEKLFTARQRLQQIARYLAIARQNLPDLSFENCQEYAVFIEKLVHLRKEQASECIRAEFQQWAPFLDNTNNRDALEALHSFISEHRSEFQEYHRTYTLLVESKVNLLDKFANEKFLKPGMFSAKRELLQQIFVDFDWIRTHSSAVQNLPAERVDEIEGLLSRYTRASGRILGAIPRYLIYRKIRATVPKLNNSDATKVVQELSDTVKAFRLRTKTESIIKHDLSFLLLNDVLNSIMSISSLEFEKVKELNLALLEFYTFDLTLRQALHPHCDPSKFIETLRQLHTSKDVESIVDGLYRSTRFKVLEMDIEHHLLEGKLTSIYKNYLSDLLEKLEETPAIDGTSELIEAIRQLPLEAEVHEMETALDGFPRTLSLVKQLTESPNNSEAESFLLNLAKYVEVKELRDKINHVNLHNRETPGQIADRIRVLDDRVLELTRQYIQHQIDLHLYSSLQDGPIQAEIQRFSRLVHRSRHNVTTFEEMKREIDFSALLHVFPCWIMSLEDVARVFPVRAGLFDYVIIDEASQCHLGSALPALYKAKCAIIVGDDKQLPNASLRFFPEEVHRSIIQKHGMHAVQYGHHFDILTNSLFDLSKIQAGSHRAQLVEHYRSYPEIINYCNDKFYGNLEIMTQLKALQFSLRDKSLNLIKVSGATESNKINEAEAQAIVSHIATLIEDSQYDNRSIGVISLFQEQASFIGQLLRQRFPMSVLDKYKLLSGTADSFQGDERDVIIYSWRKAPNSPFGIFNFIGEGRDEGQKRWNVALSRAREQVYCFISDDMDSFPPTVRDYLRYVNDPKTFTHETKHFGSGFEQEVHDELVHQHGFTVFPQFRSCNFLIDLVVTDGKQNYLAVECDGYPYHYENGLLKESDVERQRVLEKVGWKVLRICSRDFYSDRRRQEIEKVISYFRR